MPGIVTDKVARRGHNLPPMIEIEMPCCGTPTLVEELTDSVGCETCGVVLELDDAMNEALPAAA
jgi:hypothetical protein